MTEKFVGALFESVKNVPDFFTLDLVCLLFPFEST